MNNNTDILSEALRLLTNGWTQGEFAIDAEGNRIDKWWDSDACTCFCLAGALDRATFSVTKGERTASSWSIENFVEMAIKERDNNFRGSYIGWNDASERTIGEVLEVVERAVELSKADSVQTN
jgi:hypothetical protein